MLSKFPRGQKYMKRIGLLLFPLLLLGLAQVSYGQLWTGVVAPNRAADWSSAGVVGDIPSASWSNCTTSACNTLFGGSVTASTIQSALSSAPANSVVRIPAGTFTLTAGFSITQSNVTLRGAGAGFTKLIMNGVVSGGGLGLNR